MCEQKITLLSYTPNPLAVIYSAFRQCYYNGFIGDTWEDILEGTPPPEKQEAFIAELVRSGHTSPLEHVSFTFAIEGVSRALSHQLVRHRIASYSQQSQRYVTAKDFAYITPPSIANNEKAHTLYKNLMQTIQESYKDMITLLQEDGVPAKKSIEDVRFILPQATETRLVMTMNCRALLNFFQHRCCVRAQWEIYALAMRIKKECTAILPAVFKKSGAPCYSLRYCPEPKHLACGLFPTREED